MIKNKDTIIPVTEDVESIEKKSHNHHDFREIIANKFISNEQNYENKNSNKMDEVNKKINKWDTQLPLQQFHKNNLSVKGYKYKHHPHDQYCLNQKYSRDNHISSKCDMPKNEDHITNNVHNLNDTNVDKSEHETKIIIAQTQKNKTAISLLNEWAMRGEEKKPFVVSYLLVDVTGHAHNPRFTFMCQVYNIKAYGDGKSKKEAKQNAAARMCEKLFDFKIDFLNNNDKMITSTTIDNFEVNENDTFLSSIEGSQIIDETNSDMSDEKLQQFKYKEVQTAHCNMNPIGALQELCIIYKWTPPFYNFKENKNQKERKTILYKVICKILHLQTMGTARTKKEAKRKAAHLMFEKIVDIGADKLNELKSAYPITLLPTEDYEQNKCIAIYNEKNEKISNKWFSAYCFQSYLKIAMANKITLKDTTIFPLVENKDNPTPIDQQLELYTMKMVQYIENSDPNTSNVNKLNILCKELGFQAVYVCLGVQKKEDIKNNIGQDEEYAMLVQVTTVPVTITTGYGTNKDKAAEEAAKFILETFKAMLLFTKQDSINLNNNEEEKIVNVL
ncbi:uncharacterized protein LOC112596755 [Melanaphis sacchari]|uniref:RISC-loading complex subunit tarbp2 n=1 Tax=Melanaphis sacchari TaxID=742174 RepID=A0A2H8TGW1_9HEMI|nr:uncharacterized protein LOC112596755 [Melanaphis sacchari]